MKPHPRIRKTIKWSGAAVTLLLVVVWIGSGWRTVRMVVAKGVAVSVADGRVVFERFPELPASVLNQSRWFELNSAGFDYLKPVTHAEPFSNWSYHIGWGMGRHERGPWWSLFYFPLWIPAVLLASVILVINVRGRFARRRARLNLCPKCNYDRAGIAKDAVCPECGASAKT
jgi:hypothetical protein